MTEVTDLSGKSSGQDDVMRLDGIQRNTFGERRSLKFLRLRSRSIRFWESQFEDSARNDKRNGRDNLEIDEMRERWERWEREMQGLCMILQDSSQIW